MKPDIISKITAELDQPIHAERQVVYVLAEIRKLLEIEAIRKLEAGEVPGNRHFALKFYCDWAVHVRLTHAGAQRIVEHFDRYQKLIDEEGTGHNDPAAKALLFSKLDALLKMSKFRNQLRECLDEHGIDSTIASNDGKWLQFLGYYSRVIEDAPLISEAKHLDRVGGVTITVFDNNSAGAGRSSLALRWRWVSKKTGIPGNIVRHF